MKKFIFAISALLLSFLIILVLAEIILRLTPTLGTKKIHPHFNHELFRDYDHAVAKPPNTIRISFIGDSYTFGAGVEDQERFSNLTGFHMRQKNIKSNIEILNFGRIGSDNISNLYILQEKALTFDPDIVVLSFVPNDFSDHAMTRHFVMHFIQESNKYAFFKHFEDHLKLAVFFDSLLISTCSNLNEEHIEWLNGSFREDKNGAFSSELRSLDQMMNIMSGRQGIVLFFPYFVAKNEKELFFYRQGKDILNRFCQAYGLRFIEVYDLLGSKPYYKWWVSSTNHHPNIAAHAIVGNYLADVIANNIMKKNGNL